MSEKKCEARIDTGSDPTISASIETQSKLSSEACAHMAPTKVDSAGKSDKLPLGSAAKEALGDGFGINSDQGHNAGGSGHGGKKGDDHAMATSHQLRDKDGVPIILAPTGPNKIYPKKHGD